MSISSAVVPRPRLKRIAPMPNIRRPARWLVDRFVDSVTCSKLPPAPADTLCLHTNNRRNNRRLLASIERHSPYSRSNTGTHWLASGPLIDVRNAGRSASSKVQLLAGPDSFIVTRDHGRYHRTKPVQTRTRHCRFPPSNRSDADLPALRPRAPDKRAL